MSQNALAVVERPNPIAFHPASLRATHMLIVEGGAGRSGQFRTAQDSNRRHIYQVGDNRMLLPSTIKRIILRHFSEWSLFTLNI